MAREQLVQLALKRELSQGLMVLGKKRQRKERSWAAEAIRVNLPSNNLKQKKN